ncbi:Carboxypeptidase-like regulatory domain-containing protein [Tenacibaculum sp. 190130A14a]|uniref:Carboxypeptidase-like regulatory domain-containing protein n=1 Tax=Tenacibaculum polynesiense TaxID=3137857 RepID=A0ABM9PC62_9FLAO
MNKAFIYIIILLCASKLYSQEHRKYMYAEINDKIGPVVNAHIINLQTGQGTFSNDNGEFRILSKENDSLKISSVGYKTISFIVQKSNFGIEKNNISLQKVAIDLDEVEVKRNNLLGNLTSDSKLVKKEKEINAETLKLPYAGSKKLTPAERKLYTAKGGDFPFLIGFGAIVSVDYILNSISGRIKKLEKGLQHERLEQRVTYLKSTFSNYIITDLKINESDLYRFIYFCLSDENFYTNLQLSEVVIINSLKDKSLEFKKLNPKDYK